MSSWIKSSLTRYIIVVFKLIMVITLLDKACGMEVVTISSWSLFISKLVQVGVVKQCGDSHDQPRAEEIGDGEQKASMSLCIGPRNKTNLPIINFQLAKETSTHSHIDPTNGFNDLYYREYYF